MCRVLPTGFFVTVAEPGTLRDHVAQAVAEMYACAKLLKYVYRGPLYSSLIFSRKEFLRGALTDGHQWIFLILHLNSDGNGGTFKRSVTVHLSVSRLPGDLPEVAKPTADLIAGILSFWVSG